MSKPIIFTPKAVMSITNVCFLGIDTFVRDGETCVRSAYFDETGKRKSVPTVSIIRFDSKGHPYFIKSRQRFFLNDFMRT